MSAEKLTEWLRELEQNNGRLVPADVVEAARDAESPAHSHFTWDDTEAARKQRLMEARTLIRSVRLDITVRDVPLSVVGYVRDPEVDARQAGYRNVMTLRTEEDAARATVVDEMKRVSNAVRRAKGLALVLGVASDIEQIDAIARSVTERISDTVAGPASAEGLV